MLLAIDFDRTFMLDPPLWGAFLKALVLSDHRAIVVTCRTAREDNYELIRDALARAGALHSVEDILCTSHRPKRTFAVACGYQVDVWVDDIPEVIGARDEAEVREIEARFHVAST
jgi:hypothetical protein